MVLNVGADESNLQVIKIAKIIQQLVPGSKLEFLNENPNSDSDELIRDRKIKNSRDKRTYRVSFEKLNRTIPTFNCHWNVENGVRNMITGLNEITFNTEFFRNRGFYRLQHLEDLHERNEISADLRWKEIKLFTN
jgi:hypothetical protein